ncbi:hypothetical protein CS378_00425 [Rhodococcus ruber]|uniref:hypothetical protein n=1 Tax=Rhodococcus TaxID=1827 RepID=UPI00029A719C|nr:MULTISPECIES: hypothetical protein [Rhodococcus]ATQ27331.1 hypothetical protein CS378_00425 [Rhodococcus ruber]
MPEVPQPAQLPAVALDLTPASSPYDAWLAAREIRLATVRSAQCFTPSIAQCTAQRYGRAPATALSAMELATMLTQLVVEWVRR